MTTDDFPLKDSFASISRCGRYRYALGRTWGDAHPRLNFIMLNPSTANATEDDPTITRCTRRARLLGYGALYVTNLFAYRATDPKELKKAPDPIGSANDPAIITAAKLTEERGGMVVCGWGANGAHMDRAQAVLTNLRAEGITP